MFRSILLTAGVAWSIGTVPVAAATLTATKTSFDKVFASAKAGDVIKMTGSFGRIALQNRSFSTAVTLDATAATFTDTLSLSSITGLKLIGGHYGNAAATAPVAIRVYKSSNITVSSPTIVGNGSGSHGIDVSTSSNITIDKGSFTGLKLGVGFISVTNGRMTNNQSIRSSSDGFNVADSHNILVSKNTCSGTSIMPNAHPDCVQLWSVKGRVPQSGIEISDNIATGATQGFTSFDGSAGGGDGLKFLRNTVNTSYPQGIACYECRNSQFIGNKVSTIPGSQYKTSMNIVGGTGNTLSGNVVSPYDAPPPVKVTPTPTPNSDPTRAATLPSFGRFTDVPETLTTVKFDQRDVTTLAAGASAAAVPEPGVWALMIGGFGLVGFAARRRRTMVSA